MADYILNDPHNRNITAVVHTGDVVDSYDEDWQWDNASSFVKIASELPTVVLAGNHDVNKYVSHERAYEYYANRPIITKWNEGCTLYQDGRASYRLISEGGCDFIIGAIGFDFDKAMMQWLRDAFLDHSDRVGILLAHSVLYNWQQFTPEGKMLNENIVIPCSNIRLVLCGHFGGIDYRTDERDEGQRQVTTMMFNPQYLYKRGYGYMRFLSFDPILRTVTASIYSPVFDSETFPDQKQELQCVIIENAF